MRIKTWQIITVIICIALGIVLHFTYEWSNNNQLVGIFSAINESTWEHLKLLYFPMLLSTIIGYFYLKKETSNYICAKTKGILISLAFIVIFFYTYSGILGTSIDVINIISFYVAVILGQYHAYKKIKYGSCCNNYFAIAVLFVLLISFIAFTFFQPNLGIFIAP